MNSKKKAEKLKNNVVKSADIIDNSSSADLVLKMREKIVKIQEIIQNTIISIQLYKKHHIFGNSDVTICLTTMNEIYVKTTSLYDAINIAEIEKQIDVLQNIVDKLALIITSYGTYNIEDLLFISCGSDFVQKIGFTDDYMMDKYKLIAKYVHPFGYKTSHWKQMNKQKAAERNSNTQTEYCVNKITDDAITIEYANDLECFNADLSIKQYHIRVHGLRLIIHNEKTQKTIIVNCICDDISLDCITNKYKNLRIQSLHANKPVEDDNSGIISRIIDTLSLKDILVYGNTDIYKRRISIMTDVNMITNNKIDITINKFLENDMYSQRNMLINLLLYNKNDEIQYITYLLYDLIALNTADQVDSSEQILLYDSFPWKIKLFFKEAMKHTIKYSQDMMQKYDINRISLEQQIYLLKVPENVKEKAIAKLKELKGKTDDSGAKAKQYLEGLLKIPFGIYKQEPILKKIKDINTAFSGLLVKQHPAVKPTEQLVSADKYTNIEIMKYTTKILNRFQTNILTDIQEEPNTISLKNAAIVSKYINNKQANKPNKVVTGITKPDRLRDIATYLSGPNIDYIEKCRIYDLLKPSPSSSVQLYQEYKGVSDSVKNVEQMMNQVVDVLDQSIYGHSHAKNQILKIVGQWMNGEQTGYCFGFEGSPGIGKTSLAKKGLSGCLLDENGKSRPFAFIALGGSCNGSTLEGHSYTYVNSIWGRIIDILMETKCMNPIIYIDELDKVSKTEHGKEIIGILTHLIDTTQNDSFQDKYFSGIDVDLSKALFIFSYNDPELIDRILLDRIHRIKFDNLSIADKLIIIRTHILPEIHAKMGIPTNTVILDDAIIEHIIEYYTMEPGVRKLKEILFDLYGEINLELLKCENYETAEYPIRITKGLLESRYLKKYNQIHEKKISAVSEVGTINGLWANALGKGGIIPIETSFFPSSAFLELRLTGLQGDVMKEGMNVAKSVAWSLTPDERKTELLKFFENTRSNGLHIHCPDGSVSKDGPSAGAAITSAIYSLFNNKLIRNTVAMTGEIDLRGNITAIGGLESKILGGIRAGVNTFLFPEANDKEYQDFAKKYLINDKYKKITFIKVKHIKEVFEQIWV